MEKRTMLAGTIITCLCLLGVATYLLIGATPSKPSHEKMTLLMNDVESHLEKEGTKTKDIKTMTVQFQSSLGKKGPYSVDVIFIDEPDVSYRYRRNKDGEIYLDNNGRDEGKPKQSKTTIID